MPGVAGVTVVITLVCFFIFARKAAGASRARHSLRPLISEGELSWQNSDASRRGNVETYSFNLAPLAGRGRRRSDSEVSG